MNIFDTKFISIINETVLNEAEERPELEDVTEQEYNTEIENAKFEEQLAPKINDPFAAIKSHEPPKLG